MEKHAFQCPACYTYVALEDIKNGDMVVVVSGVESFRGLIIDKAVAAERERCIRVIQNALAIPITMAAFEQNTLCSTIVDYINRGDER